MASSTPFTEKRPSILPKRANIHAQALSLLKKEISRNNTSIVKIRPKNYDLWLDGEEVERFIKGVENIVEIEGESGRDIEIQLSFWTKDHNISYNIEGMLVYET
ncbi:hypothetical protein O181_065085 [Austropuccinia psidii MF-1]|uniref:Uncharacterized protein n=1 Tax=Austropuccinia psidii MF-1 TaxID=1389203 RepID=A0A9Q3I3R6_9BASI|nr:hypothetical protein [Austropuccinia psidii MF-1]